MATGFIAGFGFQKVGSAWTQTPKVQLVEVLMGAAVTVGVRPEDLHVSAQGIAATVEVVEPLGSETLLYWKSATGDHVSRAAAGESPALGTRAALSARPDGVLLFEPTTGASLLAAESAASRR